MFTLTAQIPSTHHHAAFVQVHFCKATGISSMSWKFIGFEVVDTAKMLRQLCYEIQINNALLQ